MSTVETSQTLDRGLQVVAAVAREPAGVSISQIATTMGLSRTIIYRLTTTLERHGYLRRGPDGRFRLGVAPLPLAQQVAPMVRDAADPIVALLSQRADATAVFTMVDGAEALVLAAASPTGAAMHVGITVGSRTATDRSVAGQAAVAARANGRALNPGWVVSGQDASGWHAVAAPVLGIPGLEASITVVTLTALDVTVVGPVVVAAAQDISRALR